MGKVWSHAQREGLPHHSRVNPATLIPVLGCLEAEELDRTMAKVKKDSYLVEKPVRENSSFSYWCGGL